MSLVDTFWSGPPVTRSWAALIFVESVLFKTSLLSGYHLLWRSDLVFQIPPQIWRLVTSFGLTDGLSIIFLPYMVWNYGGWLERECPRFTSSPGSFFVYVIFVGLISLVVGSLYWGQVMFTSMLVNAVVYTWSQENRGRPTNVYFVTIDAKYLWLAMLGFTFLQAGLQATLVEATGPLAAHLYDFLTVYWPKYGKGSNMIVTPHFVAAWFGGGAGTRTYNVAGGTAQRPRADEPAAGRSTGFSSWNSRGQGRRLGD